MSKPTSVPVLIATLLTVAVAEGQITRLRTTGTIPHWDPTPYYYFSPVDALSWRVHAQAEIMRARSDAAVNHAIARRIRADARAKELENWVEQVRARWERKSIGEAERFRRAFHFLDHKDRAKAQRARQIIDHPDLAGPAITNGRTLNFLLNQLSFSAVSFESASIYDELSSQQQERLRLPASVLDSVTLRQPLPGGEHLVFRATEGAPLAVDWWPFALRNEHFQPHRDAFLKARALVVDEARKGTISPKRLRGLYEAFVKLSAEFDAYYTKRERVRDGMRSWSHYKKAADFLNSLYGEVRRLETTGDIRILEEDLRFDPQRDGSHVIALLNFMSRNGLEFAPAKPGDEHAYHHLFKIMRELYLATSAAKATPSDERS